MKYNKQYKKVFGTNELGHINFPTKFSNIKVSRIRNCDKMGGCSICFPHGFETTNSKDRNAQRNWKKFRKHQWKEIS